MMKAVVFVVAGVIGFLVAFSITAKDEIAAEVDRNLDDDFVVQCVPHLERNLPNAARATEVCGCMKSEFKTRGLKLTDSFGDDFAEMQRVTQACATLYS